MEMQIGNELLDQKNLLVMKLLHYFIIDKNYNPIILQGAENEIWLENLDEDYRVVRIVTGTILNDEQFGFDMFKTKRILKKIKAKTFSFNLNTLSIFLDLDKDIETDTNKNITCISASDEDELRKNKLIGDIFPDMFEKLKYTEEGMQLFIKITNDINEHNIKDSEKIESIFKPKYPLITYILIILNVSLYFFPLIFGKSNYFINRFSVYAPYIRNGEYYRLITGAFLHSNIIHLLCNMYALYILGSQLESFVGRFKYICIYFFSALCASLLSMIFLGNGVSIGASGAIFGIMGAIVYFGYHYRVYLGNVVRTSIIPIIIMNLILGFTINGIDNWAHIGGLIGGFIINIGLGVKYKSTTFERVNGLIISLIYLAFLIFMAFIYIK